MDFPPNGSRSNHIRRRQGVTALTPRGGPGEDGVC